MGRIGSTKLVLPKWHKYGILNRVIRVCTSVSFTESSLGGAFFEICLGENQVQERKNILEINK